MSCSSILKWNEMKNGFSTLVTFSWTHHYNQVQKAEDCSNNNTGTLIANPGGVLFSPTISLHSACQHLESQISNVYYVNLLCREPLNILDRYNLKSNKSVLQFNSYLSAASCVCIPCITQWRCVLTELWFVRHCHTN